MSGSFGAGWLGLPAANGELCQLRVADPRALADRYHLPWPRLALRDLLLAHASACADVSDGLVSDLSHIAGASGCGVEFDLARLPLSIAANHWLERQPDRTEALGRLATGGDDYELVFSAPSGTTDAIQAAARTAGVAVTPIGRITEAPSVSVLHEGTPIRLERSGWRHS